MDDCLSSSELWPILRWSLNTTSTSTIASFNSDPKYSTAADFGEDITNPLIRRLIGHILFSRRFIWTYYIAVGIILAIFTCIHWVGKYGKICSKSKARSEQTSNVDDATSTASSSSSTLQGSESPPEADKPKLVPHEDTPLLGGSFEINSPSFILRLWHRFAAILAHQPAPIIALTSASNELPTNGTSLLILGLLSLNFFYLFYRVPLSISLLFAFADRAGLCFVVNLPVLYILAAKSIQPLKALAGWSYEGLNIFHRRLGEWMTVLAVCHAIGMIGVWYTLLLPLGESLLRFLSTRLVLLGIFTFFSYLVIYTTSTGFFRRKYYETFLGLHIFLQVAALLLLFFHHHGSRPFILASAAVWTLDRVLMRMFVSKRKVVSTLQVAPDKQTVLIHTSIDIYPSATKTCLSITNGWLPGQHVFVSIPALSTLSRFEAHPFTIASPAPPPHLLAGSRWPLQLIVRAQLGFSKQLIKYAAHHQHTEVLIDGPYGRTDVLEALRTTERRCLIAGGSGIAVTYPLAWDVMVQRTPEAVVSSRIRYEAGKKVAPKLAPPQSLDRENCRFQHLWVRTNVNHSKWLTVFPKPDCMALEWARFARAESKGAEVPQDGHTPENGFVRTADLVSRHHVTELEGRPDLELEVREWVERRLQIGCGGGNDIGNVQAKNESICIVVSGPDGMVRDVRNAVARLVRDGWAVTVFVEKFGW